MQIAIFIYLLDIQVIQYENAFKQASCQKHD
jgi:hypothetical protein